VNANHARPLAAFWLLAIVAGVIIGAELRASDSPATVGVALPTPMRSSEGP
jgi:hypothetical protein